jgi:chromosome partitioning protein
MRRRMFIVGVVNSKGGCGKTTVCTHLAARYAAQGHHVVVGDLDRQQSALRWIERRPAHLPTIEAADLDLDALVLPFGEGRMVVDAPAGLKRKALEIVVRACDALVVPLLPSGFDESATARFLETAAELKPLRKGRRPLVVVGNRVRPRSAAARRLDTFLAGLDFPAVTRLTDSQAYVNASDTGTTIFDLPAARHPTLSAEWAPLLAFLDAAAAEKGLGDDPLDERPGGR